MKVGIMGFARSGKTTVFNALTGAQAAVGAFGSRDANMAVLKVPDERVDHLETIHKPKKKTYAEFEFVDVPPNESTADEKALDNTALNHLRTVDALVHVVRCFEKEEVVHPLGGVDAVRDCKAMEEEFQLTDLIVIEKRIARLEKEKKTEMEYDVLVKCRDCVEGGRAIRGMDLTGQEWQAIAGYGFLSQKQVMLLGNFGEEAMGDSDPSGLSAYAAEHDTTLVALCGAMELEVGELPEEDRQAFREDLGMGDESRVAFLKSAYEKLGLISFLTAADPEVRAWTIRRGTKAVDAAGVIHSDIKRGFIRAETVAYDDFVAAGSMAKAKEAGRVRLEGKDYEVQDGDIILFRFNV